MDPVYVVEKKQKKNQAFFVNGTDQIVGLSFSWHSALVPTIASRHGDSIDPGGVSIWVVAGGGGRVYAA